MGTEGVLSSSAADFLAEDRAGAVSLERVNPADQVLVSGRDPRIADDSHFQPPHFASKIRKL
jgi:hypothetical protein